MAFYDHALSFAMELGSSDASKLANNRLGTESSFGFVRESLRSIIRDIPKSHRDLLIYLLDFMGSEEMSSIGSGVPTTLFQPCIPASDVMEEYADLEAF